jgi:hypothetical protein
MVTTPDTEFEPWPPEVEPEAAAIRKARGVFVHGRSPEYPVAAGDKCRSTFFEGQTAGLVRLAGLMRRCAVWVLLGCPAFAAIVRSGPRWASETI